MADTITFHDNFVSFLYIALGVAIGVLLPILSKYVREHFKAGAIDFTPYLLLLLFSLALSVVILAAMRNQSPNSEIHWSAALLAGYGGEATLEKLFKS